jgi:GNAT superfamily N-acetyltransferase
MNALAGGGVRTVRSGVSVRPFVMEDLPGVLDLLSVSLGGGPAGRRTPETFRWKHLDNPFGSSYLLVAERDGRLIGLRALMRWSFVAGDRTVRAARAVDTATHPDYRGRGVFSRLTRAALEAMDGEVDLVFNTPNDKSGPGYLKLGWRQVGRVPVAVRVRRPLRLLGAARSGSRPGPAPPVAAVPAAQVLARDDEVAPLIEGGAGWPPGAGPPRLVTRRDAAYLRWRYGAAPLLGYRAVTEERDGRLAGIAVFRFRRRGSLWESTVAEVLAGGDAGTAGRLLRRVARAAPADHLTFHAPARSPLARAAARSGFLRSPASISLVVNPLRDDIRPDPTTLGAWALSLGDLEVF